ncbi:MAG: transporter substrate-binding protein [Holophagaceae bacterium]|nr:transporter substrate-binding protein [Holophagaceae bacterium]
MNKLHFTSVLAAALAITGIGCEKKPTKEIKIGFVQAQSGMFASFGQGGLFGVQAAIDDINKLGGVKVGDTRLPLKLVAVDNESDPNKAGALAESLINQDHVQFIVTGDEPPPMHAGVSQMADRYKVPYITSCGVLEPWMGMRNETPTKWQYTWSTGTLSINTPAKPGDFRAKPGYTVMDTWMTVLNQYAPQTNRKVGIIASDEPDGRGWYTLFGPALQKLGYEVVGLDKNLGLMSMETTDFSSVVQAWKAANVEILWGNCPAPFFGTVWKQAKAMGFNPKIVSIGRGALYLDDVKAWGGELPLGVGTEVWWEPSIKGAPGIGGTTPQSLAERWVKETKRPVYPSIGPGYAGIQVLVDAIERAGSIDPEKVNAALATTDLATLRHRVKFDENHFSQCPAVFGQWQKSNNPNQPWELKVIHSDHDFWPTTGKALFPVPTK